MKSKIEIPPHGHVFLVDCLGSDRRIVDTARLSYAGESKGDEADKKLLFYLFRMRHTSPFESCNVTFHIKFPIFLMRQFVRHRTFRLNEISARYTEMADEFYLPIEWRAQDTKNKQGSVPATASLHNCFHHAKAAYDCAYRCYCHMLEEGCSREQARMVLPVGIYTEIMVNIDLHNLIHFFRLRLDPHAQGEMRDVAQAMFDLVSPLFPWTFEAFHRFKWILTDEWDNIDKIVPQPA
jgi:thymidylate synthase (FAD)